MHGGAQRAERLALSVKTAKREHKKGRDSRKCGNLSLNLFLYSALRAPLLFTYALTFSFTVLSTITEFVLMCPGRALMVRVMNSASSSLSFVAILIR